MTARHIVSALLEEEDPKEFLYDRTEDWEKFPLHQTMANVPGAVRRKGEGHDDQWEIEYGNWLFVVSIYEDGSQIWSAHYKVPAFDWDDPEDKERGFSWGGGCMLEKLLPGNSPVDYLGRLKRMADLHPNVWRDSRRSIPKMPNADNYHVGY